MKIYIVRHGYTHWNSLGKLQGVQDTELHETGLEQAKTLGKRLKCENITKIYTSPLKRAFTTAEIINEYTHVPIIKDENLIEMNFGVWQGLTLEDVKKVHSEFFSYWDDNRFETVIPNGESYEIVSIRAFKTIEKIAKSNDKNVLLISHGSLIRALFCKILNINIKDSDNLNIDNCGISVLEYKDGCFFIETINDLGHFQ